MLTLVCQNCCLERDVESLASKIAQDRNHMLTLSGSSWQRSGSLAASVVVGC